MRWHHPCLGIVFLWFMAGGVTHFTAPDFYLHITPPWVPWPLAVIYISGVFEIAGAIGILLAPLRQLAGNGLILLTLAVTPANIYMSMNPELFSEASEAQLTLRLGAQVLLLMCIYWSTRGKRWRTI
ncbi:DoxX family protein [Shimia sp. R11_0]|uniref:DoxX family protein n=1 Tax=Shimia sp. R11_0 TaxID=2821096 RepID=UPI001AD9D0D6|nr:DoxX family protein [Shimia sp. R11_0]MBO9479606.1 DoxX family protein [Shimia sp. R11_0]